MVFDPSQPCVLQCSFAQERGCKEPIVEHRQYFFFFLVLTPTPFYVGDLKKKSIPSSFKLPLTQQSKCAIERAAGLCPFSCITSRMVCSVQTIAPVTRIKLK